MKRLLALTILSAALLAGPLVAPAAAGDLTAYAGSQGGLYMEVQVVWGKLWNDKVPGLHVSPISGGGMTNPFNVAQAKPDEAVGITDTGVSIGVWEGTGAFKSRAPNGLKNLRALFRFNALSYTNVLVRSRSLPSGVKTMRDLLKPKPKFKWALMERKNPGSVAAERLFAAYGVSFEDVDKWGGAHSFNSHNGIGELLINGQVDAGIVNTRQPAAFMLDMDASMPDLVWLTIDEDIIDKIVADSRGGYIKVTQPPDVYRTLKAPYTTFAVDHIMFVNENMDNELAYQLTKTALANPDVIRQAVPAMKDFDPKSVCKATGAFPLHPGAERACKEMGGL